MSINGTTSDIRKHLLNWHSDNHDVVNDIPAIVPKKCIEQENQNKLNTFFKNKHIKTENGLLENGSYEVESDLDETLSGARTEHNF